MCYEYKEPGEGQMRFQRTASNTLRYSDDIDRILYGAENNKYWEELLNYIYECFHNSPGSYTNDQRYSCVQCIQQYKKEKRFPSLDFLNGSCFLSDFMEIAFASNSNNIIYIILDVINRLMIIFRNFIPQETYEYFGKKLLIFLSNTNFSNERDVLGIIYHIVLNLQNCVYSSLLIANEIFNNYYDHINEIYKSCTNLYNIENQLPWEIIANIFHMYAIGYQNENVLDFSVKEDYINDLVIIGIQIQNEETIDQIGEDLIAIVTKNSDILYKFMHSSVFNLLIKNFYISSIADLISIILMNNEYSSIISPMIDLNTIVSFLDNIVKTKEINTIQDVLSSEINLISNKIEHDDRISENLNLINKVIQIISCILTNNECEIQVKRASTSLILKIMEFVRIEEIDCIFNPDFFDILIHVIEMNNDLYLQTINTFKCMLLKANQDIFQSIAFNTMIELIKCIGNNIEDPMSQSANELLRMIELEVDDYESKNET